MQLNCLLNKCQIMNQFLEREEKIVRMLKTVFDPEYERYINLDGYDHICHYNLQPEDRNSDSNSNDDNIAFLKFHIEVSGLAHLSKLLAKLEQQHGILHARRAVA